MADLQGPKLRIGDLDATRTLERGQEVVVAAEGSCGDGDLPVAPAVIGDVLAPGNDVLIDDGLVRLRVEEVEDGRAAAPSSSAVLCRRTKVSTCPAFRCRSRR